MGDFRMTIEAVGGHGCNRRAKQGEEFVGCGQDGCPDCLFARFVSEMQRAGMRPYVAKMHHWPADMAQHDRAFGHDFKEEEKCSRCGAAWSEETAPASAAYRPCRAYDEAHEVIDDYTERDVKYPTGGFVRATGKRVKGQF